MLKIYFVRHAQAMGNILKFFQGRTDCELSDLGKEQLKYLAERFKEIPIEKIYSSPLKRTMETAEAVNKYHGVPIIPDNGLIEINGGVLEGRPWSEFTEKYPVEFDLWQNKMQDFYIENGENMREVFERMKNTMAKIISENQGKTIAVVSHGCALKNYLCYANGDDIEKIADVGWSTNTAVSLVEYDENNSPKIIFKNDISHLSEDASTPMPFKTNENITV